MLDAAFKLANYVDGVCKLSRKKSKADNSVTVVVYDTASYLFILCSMGKLKFFLHNRNTSLSYLSLSSGP